MTPATTPSQLLATPPDFESYLALGIYVGIAVFLIAVLLLLSWGLGQKTRSRQKQEPYESGIYPLDNARLKGPVPFYLVAIFFVIFDVEVIFVASWAVASDRLGWPGFAHVCFFIFILFLGLVHIWKTGGLDWGPRAQRESRRAQRSTT
ncbi:MAG: NADH-quinone oxidoreductase subunit A [Desulfuromonadales bacterium]|jgi:NADH-quinone oxidoreductase subunit A|nr:NADH-quinone oxidoreductase subunit A [Desulfuromonadales bacterium]